MAIADTPAVTCRAGALRQVLEGLRNPHGAECLCVVGGAFAGKSILLGAALNALREDVPSHFVAGGTFVGQDGTATAQALIGEIDTFLQSVGHARCCVAIDDFDLLVSSLPLNALQTLRERFAPSHVGLIVSSREHLASLARRAAQISRLEGLFSASIHCGPLTSEEALSLVSSRLPGELPDGSMAGHGLITWVLAQAGPHPFFLDDILNRLRKRVAKVSPIDEVMLRRIADGLDEAWDRHFARLWTTLDDDEVELLARLSDELTLEGDRELARRTSRLRIALCQRDGKWTAINPRFGQWVKARSLAQSSTDVPTALVRQSLREVSRTFDDLARDPDPLYYLKRAVQNVDPMHPNYDSANAMLRTAMENFIMVAASASSGDYDGMRGGQGSRREVLRLITRRAELDEAFVDYWNSFISYLNKNGPHPGLPAAADDTRFRLGGVCDFMVLISQRLRTRAAGSAPQS